ncbi:hypothetical protein [uncultured Lactobacillus sp.]|uniref:hypothetical protein n=1 Tax=uncultured Lactobacillus sp. TaxID=153152 RepID=UPI002804A483|nr:hypothetical protein [uncultured Lactobacillus sp.]
MAIKASTAKEDNSSQDTNYLLSTEANRIALQKGMSQEHSQKILTPQEWDELQRD